MKILELRPGDILVCKLEDSNHFAIDSIRDSLRDALKPFGISGILVLDAKMEFEVLRAEPADPAKAIQGLQEMEKDLEK